jgi:hypothetical protein
MTSEHLGIHLPRAVGNELGMPAARHFPWRSGLGRLLRPPRSRSHCRAFPGLWTRPFRLGGHRRRHRRSLDSWRPRAVCPMPHTWRSASGDAGLQLQHGAHKGDRFAFRLFCRAMAAVNVVLPVNGFDSGAIAQGLFDPQGCVGKGRRRAGATRAAHLPFQVFATSVRFVEPSGVPDQADVAWLVCRVRPIDPHASPARYLSPRLVPSLGNDWILATVQDGATSCVRCRRCRRSCNSQALRG